MCVCVCVCACVRVCVCVWSDVKYSTVADPEKSLGAMNYYRRFVIYIQNIGGGGGLSFLPLVLPLFIISSVTSWYLYTPST